MAGAGFTSLKYFGAGKSVDVILDGGKNWGEGGGLRQFQLLVRDYGQNWGLGGQRGPVHVPNRGRFWLAGFVEFTLLSRCPSLNFSNGVGSRHSLKPPE
jgi:hypothetical protein